VERVKGLASREAGIALDVLDEVEDGGAFLNTTRQLEDGIGANSLEFGDRGGDRRGCGNRGIPRQVHANQLVLEVHRVQQARSGNRQNWTTD
jgi:hypothetical protein